MAASVSLEDLVSCWHQLRRAGKNPTSAELCIDCPELEPALRQKIGEGDLKAHCQAQLIRLFGPDAAKPKSADGQGR